MRCRRGKTQLGKTSKYKPLIVKRGRKHKIRKLLVDEKLPNINPSVREIWKIMSDGEVRYKKDMVAEIDDNCLDMERILPDLVQELDFSFEDIIRFMRFLPSLLRLCKIRSIEVINIPIMPNLEDYQKWIDDENA